MIAPMDEVYANESGTLTVCRFYNRGSLKDYLHRVRLIFIEFDWTRKKKCFRRDQQVGPIGNDLVQHH